MTSIPNRHEFTALEKRVAHMEATAIILARRAALSGQLTTDINAIIKHLTFVEAQTIRYLDYLDDRVAAIEAELEIEPAEPPFVLPDPGGGDDKDPIFTEG